MRTGIKWDDVKQWMQSEKFEEEEDGSFRRVYLGTVFTLSPSGKFYMPWARSNVTEEEAAKDEEFYDALHEEAEEHGYFIQSGEGDPCDIFVTEAKEDEKPPDSIVQPDRCRQDD